MNQARGTLRLHPSNRDLAIADTGYRIVIGVS